MKRKVILIFMVLLGLSWYLAISETLGNPGKAEAHVIKAEELEKKGIYVDAVTEYEEALKYEPDNPQIFVKMAKAYLESGNSKKFVDICKKTAESYQKNSDALDSLMEYYVENNYQSKAVRYLNDFVEIYPDNENAEKWFLELKGSYTRLYCHFEEMGNITNNSMVVFDGKFYGILDALGKSVIENEYAELYPFSDDGFALAKEADGSYIYIDEDGQTRKAPDSKYKKLGMLNEDCAVACWKGKYGYLDENMKKTGEFVWDDLSGIQNGIGAGEKGGKWALLNKKGQAKTEYIYDDVIMDENGLCSAQKRIFVKENGKYHIVNQKGKMIGKIKFDDAKAFREEGYAAVCKDGKWGFVDKGGELVIDCIYDDARSFSNGFAAVCEDGLWGYIDEEGNMVIEPAFISAMDISEKGTAAIKEGEESEDKEWHLIQMNLFL